MFVALEPELSRTSQSKTSSNISSKTGSLKWSMSSVAAESGIKVSDTVGRYSSSSSVLDMVGIIFFDGLVNVILIDVNDDVG